MGRLLEQLQRDMAEFEREVSEFVWDDAGRDLHMLQHIAESHSPAGMLHLIELCTATDIDGESGGYSVRFSHVVVCWLRWREKKYDRKTAFLIFTKFGQNAFFGCRSEDEKQTLN